MTGDSTPSIGLETKSEAPHPTGTPVSPLRECRCSIHQSRRDSRVDGDSTRMGAFLLSLFVVGHRTCNLQSLVETNSGGRSASRYGTREGSLHGPALCTATQLRSPSHTRQANRAILPSIYIDVHLVLRYQKSPIMIQINFRMISDRQRRTCQTSVLYICSSITSRD